MVSSSYKLLAFVIISIACPVTHYALKNQHSETPAPSLDDLLKIVAKTDPVIAEKIAEAVAVKEGLLLKAVAVKEGLLLNALQEMNQAGIIPYDEELELKIKEVRKLTPTQLGIKTFPKNLLKKFELVKVVYWKEASVPPFEPTIPHIGVVIDWEGLTDPASGVYHPQAIIYCHLISAKCYGTGCLKVSPAECGGILSKTSYLLSDRIECVDRRRVLNLTKPGKVFPKNILKKAAAKLEITIHYNFGLNDVFGSVADRVFFTVNEKNALKKVPWVEDLENYKNIFAPEFLPYPCSRVTNL